MVCVRNMSVYAWGRFLQRDKTCVTRAPWIDRRVCVCGVAVLLSIACAGSFDIYC